MTYTDVYITAANNVEELGEGPKDAERPHCWFPPWYPSLPDAFTEIRDRVTSGRFRGVQVDWGSWAARMTRDEVLAFIDEIYGPPGAYEAQNAGVMEHLADKMRELRRYVAELPADGKFAVVCEEF
jgi:hypothetical protein